MRHDARGDLRAPLRSGGFYLFDFSQRTACPAGMVSEFRTLQQSYGKLKGLMLNSEHKRDTWFPEALRKLAGR